MHDVEKLLSAYIDDEISALDRMKVEQHLQACEVCQKQIQELMTIKQYVEAAYSSIEPDDSFQTSVMGMIGAYNRKKQGRRIGITISIAAALFLCYFIFQTSSAMYATIKVFVAFFHVSISLLRALASIVSSVPNVLAIVAFSTILILIFSGWSIHRLLRPKTIG